MTAFDFINSTPAPTPFLRGAKRVQYSDFDLSFVKNPFTGDIYKKQDIESLKQSIKTIVLTNTLEKPFDSLFGGNISDYLFENIYNTGELQVEISSQIKRTIAQKEPRVLVRDVITDVQPEFGTINIKILFEVNTVSEEDIVNITITNA